MPAEKQAFFLFYPGIRSASTVQRRKAGIDLAGQKRRAALLRALLCRDAKTLLLDEPFTGMDAELVEDAVAATKRLAGERPTILVTHDRTAADLLGWPVREV